MGAIALTGDDTMVIAGTVLSNFADGNCVELTFPSTIMKLKIGKNGNALFAQDATGQMCETKIRLLRGSSDDQTLNALLAGQQNNFTTTVLLTGQFIKNIGDAFGNVTQDTYVLSGGAFPKIPEAKMNAEGDVDQSVVLWTIQWANAAVVRVIT
jgi:hypothetical protein